MSFGRNNILKNNFGPKNVVPIFIKVQQHRRYFKKEQAKQTISVKNKIKSFSVIICLQNGVNFREFKGFIQIEQGENIDNQLTIGLDQSI